MAKAVIPGRALPRTMLRSCAAENSQMMPMVLCKMMGILPGLKKGNAG